MKAQICEKKHLSTEMKYFYFVISHLSWLLNLQNILQIRYGTHWKLRRTSEFENRTDVAASQPSLRKNKTKQNKKTRKLLDMKLPCLHYWEEETLPRYNQAGQHILLQRNSGAQQLTNCEQKEEKSPSVFHSPVSDLIFEQ